MNENIVFNDCSSKLIYKSYIIWQRLHKLCSLNYPLFLAVANWTHLKRFSAEQIAPRYAMVNQGSWHLRDYIYVFIFNVFQLGHLFREPLRIDDVRRRVGSIV